MHLAPGHLRQQFNDRLYSRVIRFAAACPGHSGEERGGAVNKPSPGGEWLRWWGEDVCKIQQAQMYREGLLGTPGKSPRSKEIGEGTSALQEELGVEPLLQSDEVVRESS